MLNSLNTGVSGMQRAQDRMNVIGDNIANVNTTGFKASRLTFEDSFAQMIRPSTSGSATSGGAAGVQIGTGVASVASSYLFAQGQTMETGVSTDLYIAGDGFFLVKDVDGTEYATRAGEFRLDEGTHTLVNVNGQRLQGYTDAAATTQGDIKIDAQGRSDGGSTSAEIKKVEVKANGDVYVTPADGEPFRRGQILLQGFRNPQSLVRMGHNLYGGLDAAGRQPVAPPEMAGYGMLQAGALELSNVDLAREFSNLIATQRAFQANARMITTSDEILQELISLKR